MFFSFVFLNGFLVGCCSASWRIGALVKLNAKFMKITNYSHKIGVQLKHYKKSELIYYHSIFFNSCPA